jgi:hypothetical protein
MGYRVEKGIINPDYDYVILSKKKSTTDNILLALTRTKVGCIIIFRADGIGIDKLVGIEQSTGAKLSFYEYDNGILGVFFKRTEF